MGWGATRVNSPGRNNGDQPFGADGSHDFNDDGFPLVVVPDDISELDAEVHQYRREVAKAKSRARRRAALTAPLRWTWRAITAIGRMFRFITPW